jgi:hypothetical protein
MKRNWRPDIEIITTGNMKKGSRAVSSYLLQETTQMMNTKVARTLARASSR